MKRSNYTLIIALLTAAFLAGCSAKPDKNAQLKKLKEQQISLTKEISSLEKELAATNPETTSTKSKEVVTINLAPRKFDKYVQTQGFVESIDNILVSAKSAGVITQVFVREGDVVSKGQILA